MDKACIFMKVFCLSIEEEGVPEQAENALFSTKQFLLMRSTSLNYKEEYNLFLLSFCLRETISNLKILLPAFLLPGLKSTKTFLSVRSELSTFKCYIWTDLRWGFHDFNSLFTLTFFNQIRALGQRDISKKIIINLVSETALGHQNWKVSVTNRSQYSFKMK